MDRERGSSADLGAVIVTAALYLSRAQPNAHIQQLYIQPYVAYAYWVQDSSLGNTYIFFFFFF